MITIETASTKHIENLYKIEQECFTEEAFTKAQIAQLLTNYNSVSLIARENGEIAGFIIGTVYVDRNALNGHIITLDIARKHRRKGLATRLLQEMETIFKQKDVKVSHIEVREDNVAAKSLYEKFGYEEIGKLKNYYGKAHGIYFKKTL